MSRAKAFAVGEIHREAVGQPFEVHYVNGLHPRQIALLEPLSVGREMLDRARLKRLEATRLAVVGERKARRRCRNIGSETVRLQVALAPSRGDLRPKLHWTAEYSMFYATRRQVGGKRHSV